MRKATDLTDAVALGAIGLCILDKVRVAQVQSKVLEAGALLQQLHHKNTGPEDMGDKALP